MEKGAARGPRVNGKAYRVVAMIIGGGLLAATGALIAALALISHRPPDVQDGTDSLAEHRVT